MTQVSDKNDATRNLPPDAPTQKTRKGLKIGVPTRGEVFAALKKAAQTKR